MAKRRVVPAGNIDALQDQILRERDEQIARIKQEAADRLRELARAKQAKDAKERARDRKIRQGMAYALGEFLMRKFDGSGFNDQVAQAIVESEAFDEFMRGVRMRGRRVSFGLSPLADSPKPAVKGGGK